MSAAAFTPIGTPAWEAENRVLRSFGMTRRDVTMSTDEIAALIEDVPRGEVVGALERLAAQHVIHCIGKGSARLWRLFGTGGPDEKDDEDDQDDEEAGLWPDGLVVTVSSWTQDPPGDAPGATLPPENPSGGLSGGSVEGRRQAGADQSEEESL